MPWFSHIALHPHVHHVQGQLGQKNVQIWVAFAAICGGTHLKKLLLITYIQYQPCDGNKSADSTMWWICGTLFGWSLCTGGSDMTLKGNRGPSLSPGNGSQLKCLNHVLSTDLHPNSSSACSSSSQKANKILRFIKKHVENKEEDCSLL